MSPLYGIKYRHSRPYKGGIEVAIMEKGVILKHLPDQAAESLRRLSVRLVQMDFVKTDLPLGSR